VLHGASATTADYQRFGLGRFLTAAVRAGVPPFVLVGADGGRSRWEGDGASDDPQRMLRDELPRWARERGFDDTRLAAYGWSMGGYGALRWAQSNAGTARAARAVAALSPAIGSGDRVLDDADRLDGRRTALWCGRSDSLLDAVQELAARVPGGPAVASWGDGGHTRNYWNTVTPAAFAFIGRALAETSATR
jgi:S-formylglutathione hydrolase FrmB